MTLDELGGWPAVLRTLLAGEDLFTDLAEAAFVEILEGRATSAQIAGFAVGLRAKGETIQELNGMLDAMLRLAEHVELPAGVHAVDTCGTGGSQHRRVACFNISTIASFVIAGAGGTICKHGGRAATATSSSGDLLDALGIAIELGPEGVARCVAETGWGFCFAPRYHPAMRHAGPSRRDLGIPTAFNILGPMSNPGRVRRYLIGVADERMATRMAEVLLANGAERALIVHGGDGLDELTTTGPSSVVELRDGQVTAWAVEPLDLGLPRADREDLVGGDANVNADLARRVLAGEQGPHRDIVCLNAGAALVAAGISDDLPAGVHAARASIDGGHAVEALAKLVEVSQREATAEQA